MIATTQNNKVCLAGDTPYYIYTRFLQKRSGIFAPLEEQMAVILLLSLLEVVVEEVAGVAEVVLTAEHHVSLLLGSTLLDVSPVWFVVISALAGIVLKELEAKKK